VAIEQAVLLEAARAPLDELPAAGPWRLAQSEAVAAAARAAGLPVTTAAAVTSPWIVGAPAQKRLLRARFGASVVEMETAVLARVAAARGVPVACVRAVSDALDDTLLEPFGHDPSAGAALRALRVLRAGGWRARYRLWRESSSRAREGLSRFLAWYMSLKE
jgi:nucleoside phosphorylase